MDSTYSTTYDTSYTTTDPATTGAVMGMLGIFFLIYLVVIVLMIASLWVLYRKANKPGWASIIPIYNIIVELEIIGRPVWWLLLMLVPVLNIWISIVVALDLAKAYGKSVGMGILLILVPVIGFPVLAFSKSSRYVGPVAAGESGLSPASGNGTVPPAPGAAAGPVPSAPPAFTPAAAPAPTAPVNPVQSPFTTAPAPQAPVVPPAPSVQPPAPTTPPEAPQPPANDPGQPTPPPLQ